MDLGAKAARKGAHATCDAETEQKLNDDIRICRQVCFVAAATLPLYPRMDLRRVATRSHKPTYKVRQGWHHWEHFEGTWRCGHCLQAAPPGATLEQLPVNGCAGRPAALRRLLDRGELKGHKLQRCDTQEGKPLFFFCVACGAWAVTKCLKLLQPCRPQDCRRGTAGWDALRRIARHRHPDYQAHKDEVLTTAMRHQALELRTQPSASTYRTFRPSPGSQFEALYDRVREKERARKAKEAAPTEE